MSERPAATEQPLEGRGARSDDDDDDDDEQNSPWLEPPEAHAEPVSEEIGRC